MIGPDLQLTIDGELIRFPAVWLRDNCPCPDCLAPGTTQKLKDITDIPNGLAVTHAQPAGASLTVTFAPDQHQATFSRSWLAAHAPRDGRYADNSKKRGGDSDDRAEDAKDLWLAADLGQETGRFPVADWQRYLGEPAERVRALTAVRRLGFVLLRGVPAEQIGRAHV